MTEDEKLEKFLLSQGYYNIRFIDGGCVANYKFMFTTAVVLDINGWGYGGRYCYEDACLAELMCLGMKTLDDEPLPGYTVIKGRLRNG